MTLVKADGNAGLLLDFLGHRGGRRWSMSSMEVQSSNRTFAQSSPKPACCESAGARVNFGLGEASLLPEASILDFTWSIPRSRYTI